ncbi:MAG: DEAD/DEAH box helicase, partial [Planctomycetaceae bacterium]
MQNETKRNGVRFDDLGLSPKTLNALKEVDYHAPSPIQAAFLPVAVKGADCIGQARTGTGKTAAFVIPIAERLKPQPGVQALVLAPTRELSEQVANEAKRLTQNRNVQCVLVVGGRPIADQIRAIERGAEIVVGTPGRIIDLMNRRILDLGEVHVVVLDEADRMLDIGFRPDIEKILRRCPKDRQTMLLSATLPPPVERLAQRYMRNPERIDLSKDGVAA